MTDHPEEIARYVRHERVPAYLALGWRANPIKRPCHHDVYSAILVWAGEGEPIEPQPEGGE